MPSWMRELIGTADRTVSAPVPLLPIQSNPDLYAQFGLADMARLVVDVEYLGANSELRFFRYAGAHADRLRALDSTPILTLTAGATPVTTVATIEWPQPLAANGAVVATLARTAAGPAESTFKVLGCFLKD